MTPATAINHVLDREALPHIRHLHCAGLTCRGTVDGNRTTWFLKPTVLVCVCYLPRHMPQPKEK